MKKIVASVSLVALGASSVHAFDMSGSNGLDTSKPWNVSASLRGFYDDNPNTAPNGSSYKISTFGYELSPSLSLHLSSEQSTLSARYTYSAKYYDHKIGNSQENWSQQHLFDIKATHAFSPRYQATLTDSLAIGQEPDTLRSGSTYNSFQYVSGSNKRNYAVISLMGQLTPLLGFQISAINGYYNYDGTGWGYDGFGDILPGPAGQLNRIEQSGSIDSRWQLAPETVGIFGYQFKWTDYTANEPVAGSVNYPFPPGSSPVVYSDARNSYGHYIYVGAEHTFSPELTGAVKAGVQYSDFYNDPNGSTQTGPYAQLVATYAYRPDGSLKLGFTEQESATDLVGGQAGLITGAQTSVVYGAINQQLLTKFFGSVIGTYQNTIYQGNNSPYDGNSDNYYSVGVDLEYRLNPNFSAHTGYNFDKLGSEIPNRSFSRNRVYVGVTASY